LALSFDEIIVTNFTIGAGEQTLPIWIYSNLGHRHGCRAYARQP
jgi:ABC-type spermidine/putrescine transport system permease subunit II